MNGLIPTQRLSQIPTQYTKTLQTNYSSPLVIPFQRVPPPAKECAGKGFFYPQGGDGDKCVDKCPAPTLPDDVGHCKGGMSMA